MLERISKHVYRLMQEHETDRPHLYLIQGNNRSIAIDAGNSEAHVKKFYDEIAATRLTLPYLTILTHAHWDHSYGLHAVNGSSISSKTTAEKLKKMSTWLWTIGAMQQRILDKEDIPFCAECIMKEYTNLSLIKVIPPELTFKKKLDFDLDGIPLHVEAINNPHEDDGSIIVVDDLVILGDASSPDYYHLDGKYDENRVQAFIELLNNYSGYRIAHSHIDEILPLNAFLEAFNEEVRQTGFYKEDE